MPSKTWGTPHNIKEYQIVTESDEIPSGHKAYVFNKQVNEKDWVNPEEWYQLLSGDLSELRNRIENEIPNTKVEWIKVSLG